MFKAFRTWLERRRTLREVRVLDDKRGQGYAAFFLEQIRAARNAFDRGDRSWALKTWREMNNRYPKLIMTSEKALNLLVDLGLHDETEALIRTGLKRYPWHRAMYAVVYAHVAQGRGDLDETFRRCAILRRKFPRVAEGYTIAATCFVTIDRQDEAEAMLEQAARRFPGNFDMAVAFARHAVRRKDWPAALRRWEAVKKWSNNFLGPVGMAQSLREMCRYAEAMEFATEARERFPESPWGYAELAWIAAAEGDLPVAVQRWDLAREKCPDFALAYTLGAEAMRRIGREEEADKVLVLAITRMRFNLEVHLEYARSADRRGDHAASVERWSLVQERFPDCDEARQQSGRTRQTVEHHGNDVPA